MPPKKSRWSFGPQWTFQPTTPKKTLERPGGIAKERPTPKKTTTTTTKKTADPQKAPGTPKKPPHLPKPKVEQNMNFRHGKRVRKGSSSSSGSDGGMEDPDDVIMGRDGGDYVHDKSGQWTTTESSYETETEIDSSEHGKHPLKPFASGKKNIHLQQQKTGKDEESSILSTNSS